MEENIKVLEEYIEALRYPMSFKYTNEQKAQAIENLIKGYKELEEKFKKMTNIAETLRKENVEYIIQERQYELHYIPKSILQELLEERN